MPTYTAVVAYPYLAPDEQALAGARGALRMKVPVTETPRWTTLALDGPDEVLDAGGRRWFKWTASVTAEGGPPHT